MTLNLEDLGAVTLGPNDDPAAYWRATFLGGAMTSSTSFHFAEEPEHRAIESMMADLDATSVRVQPPTADETTDAHSAAERLLAVARGLPQGKANDPDGLADLVTAAIGYASAYRTEQES
jgi:hypothetical protein